MKYNIAERVFLVKKFYEFKQIILVQRVWKSEFSKPDAPSRSVIMNIISNFEKTGSVGHVPPKPKNPSEKREAAKFWSGAQFPPIEFSDHTTSKKP